MPDRPDSGREMVICVLNEPDYLHQVLAAFVEAGCMAATVIESQGMGRILSQDIPIFAGFRNLFVGSKPYNHTIYAIVEDPSVTERIIDVTRDVLAEVEGEAKGIVFSVPVLRFARLNKDGP